MNYDNKVLAAEVAAASTSDYLTAGTATMDIGGSRSYPPLHFRAEFIAARNYLSGVQRHNFDTLVARWRADTRKLSLVEKMATHPDYQRIIGMGDSALPLIFQEL